MAYILHRVLQALRTIQDLMPYVNDAAKAAQVATHFGNQLEAVADEIKEFRKPESHGGNEITIEEYEALVASLISRIGLVSAEMKSGAGKKG